MRFGFLIVQLGVTLTLYIATVYGWLPLVLFPILTALVLIAQFVKINLTPAPTTKKQTKKPRVQHENKDLDMAAQVQQGLLSIPPPTLPRINIAKTCQAAQNVGGDFYTFIYKENDQQTEKESNIPGITKYIDKRSHYLGIAIADVAGHGLSSALVMALSSGLTREIGYQNRSPSKTLELVNHKLFQLIKNTHIPYVTMAYGTLQPDTLTFTYANAGHCPILHQKKNGDIEELKTEGVFLGLYENEVYEEAECLLDFGDRLIFYTDGITESRNAKKIFYGEDRFKDILKKYQHLSPKETHTKIYEDIAKFTQDKPLSDDQTLVILEIA